MRPTATTPKTAAMSRRTARPMASIRPEAQYATLEQQTETAQLGMWAFLATEVLFFGALILTSSVTMVAAIELIKRNEARRAATALYLTALLGIAFLGVKGYEYLQDYYDHTVPVLDFVLKPHQQPPVELFWLFYFVATGLHALHLTIGIVAVLILAAHTRSGRYSAAYHSPIEVLGLYWSFVDVVWLFLFAAIYPIGHAG